MIGFHIENILLPKTVARSIIKQLLILVYSTKLMQILLRLLGFLAICGFANAAYSECDEEWSKIFQNHSLSNEDKVNRWEGLRASCGGNSDYDHRLAHVYEQSGRFDDAEKVLRRAISKYNNSYILAAFEYALIDLARARVFYGGNPSAESLRGVLELYLSHTKKFSEHALGFSGTAGIYQLLGEPEQAAAYSRKAINIEPDYLAHRTLAISLAQLGEFDLAIDNAISASKLNPGFRRDTDLMLSAAYAYISMDDVRNAKASLGALLQERPEVKDQEQFNRLAGFVYKRAAELESSAE